MFKPRQNGKFLTAIINTNKDRWQKVSSRSWMSKYGLRRYFSARLAQCCPQCGQPLRRLYRLHPFVLQGDAGRGIWLTLDCRCVVKKQQAQRQYLQQLLAKPRPEFTLPPALRNHTFANFTVDNFNRDAYTRCLQFAQNFHKITDGRGLILCGKAGRGKTHLACAIINYLQGRYTTAFVHVPTLLEQLRQGKVDLEQLISVNLLVLDDLGSERESDWALEKLLVIVDGRLNYNRPSIYTTNYNLAEFELTVGSRLASRILYNSLDLIVQGPDWREVKYRQAQLHVK